LLRNELYVGAVSVESTQGRNARPNVALPSLCATRCLPARAQVENEAAKPIGVAPSVTGPKSEPERVRWAKRQAASPIAKDPEALAGLSGRL